MIENILKIRLDKCRIAETKIEYLSHVIEHGIIHPNPKKVRDLLKLRHHSMHFSKSDQKQNGIIQ